MMLKRSISANLIHLSYYIKEFCLVVGAFRFILDRLLHYLPAKGTIVKVRAPAHGNIFIRARTSDLFVFIQTFLLREGDITKLKHFETLKETYEDILRGGKVPVVIDGGGNIGTVSVFFPHIFPEALIILIEPDAKNLELARLNTEKLHNVTCRLSALWSSSVPMRVLTGRAWAISVTPITEDKAVDRIADITAMTIDDVMAEIKNGELLLLKLDIEGAESEAVSSDDKWVKATPVCIIEPHDWMIAGHSSLKNLLAIPAYRDGDIIISGENLVFFPARSGTKSSSL
jgi:FkbM family methyltransferase